MTTVTLYGRDGCCLCDDARELLARLQTRCPFLLEERDIETDEQLMLAYLERIPVIAINGVERFELVVNEAELEQVLCRVVAG